MCFPASHLQACSSTSSLDSSTSSLDSSISSLDSSTSLAPESNCTSPGLQSCCGQWCCPQQYFRSHPSCLCSLLCVFLLLLSILMTCLGIPRDLVVTSFVLLLSFILPLTDLYLLLHSYLQPYRLSCHVLQFRYLCLFQHPTSSNNANDPVNLTGSGRTRSVSATPSARLGALATFAVGTPAVMSCQRRRRRSTRRSTTTIIWTPSTSTSLGLTWTWRMRWEPCL